MDYLIVEKICSYIPNGFSKIEIVRKGLNIPYQYEVEVELKIKMAIQTIFGSTKGWQRKMADGTFIEV